MPNTFSTPAEFNQEIQQHFDNLLEYGEDFNLDEDYDNFTEAINWKDKLSGTAAYQSNKINKIFSKEALTGLFSNQDIAVKFFDALETAVKKKSGLIINCPAGMDYTKEPLHTFMTDYSTYVDKYLFLLPADVDYSHPVIQEKCVKRLIKGNLLAVIEDLSALNDIQISSIFGEILDGIDTTQLIFVSGNASNSSLADVIMAESGFATIELK